MSDWAKKVLADVPRYKSGWRSTHGEDIRYDDAIAAIAKLGTGDGLVERLNRADEYEPLGHDGWEAADRIAALQKALKDQSSVSDRLSEKLYKAEGLLEQALRYNSAMHGGAGAYNKSIKDFLAELKGENCG